MQSFFVVDAACCAMEGIVLLPMRMMIGTRVRGVLLIPNFDNVEWVGDEAGDATTYSSSEAFREDIVGSTTAIAIAIVGGCWYYHYLI